VNFSAFSQQREPAWSAPRHRKRQLVLREGASGALAQHPPELVAIVPPIAVEQPERAVEQQATKTGGIDRGASERKSGAA
jgi:hypothetical protein